MRTVNFCFLHAKRVSDVLQPALEATDSDLLQKGFLTTTLFVDVERPLDQKLLQDSV
jgi:hypothetical protein